MLPDPCGESREATSRNEEELFKMRNRVLRHLIAATLTITAALGAREAAAQASPNAVYMRSVVGPPWGLSGNETQMNAVFGPAGWQDLRFETANVAAVFSPATTFVFLEGGDNNAFALEAFLATNGAAISAWVNAGGHILIDSAPNEGGGMSFGFGVSLFYEASSSLGIAANPAHPIFNGPAVPAGTSFIGSSFSHAFVTGPGLVPVIVDDLGRITLGELSPGAGRALFGGLTLPFFTSHFLWTPQPNVSNLHRNIIEYLKLDAAADIACIDWTSEVGTWGPGETQCGDLDSTANRVTYESASYGTAFGDFTYEAEIVCTRPVQPTAANTLFVRGTPQPYQTTAQWWNSGIAFNISMTGKYSIFRYQGTKMTPLQSWTTPAGNIINPSGAPNTLTVVATGGTLTFSINGTPVKTITGQTLLSGKIGLGMVRSVPTTQAGPNDTLVVNSATVTPGAPPTPTKVSLQQEKANQDANRALPAPDPLFAPKSSSGIPGGR
jgi:hypothetical protein